MDYQQWILKHLIAKYEKSKAFTSGRFTQRIALNVNEEDELQELLEHPDEKRDFLAVLAKLQKLGVIEFSWQKYEQGNLVEKIWLTPEEDAIRECYQIIDKIPAKDIVKTLIQLCSHYLQEISESTQVHSFLEELLEEMYQRQKIPRFFSEDQKLNEDILRCLAEMEKNVEEQMERIFSSRMYGDSKHFEKYIKPKVLSILRYIKKQENEEYGDDEELLREKGISRWPEIIEFTGGIKAVINDGTVIDFSPMRYGAYINSETILNVEKIVTDGIRRVIFIENKANYIWYVSHLKQADELVLFHGGCYSPVKGRWFEQMYTGSKKCDAVEYLHWSDIDIGGFRIYTRLKRCIVAELKPYKMDVETLVKFKDTAIKIKNDDYLQKLEQMQNNPEYKEFWCVIQEMLSRGIRLEQEMIIVS